MLSGVVLIWPNICLDRLADQQIGKAMRFVFGGGGNGRARGRGHGAVDYIRGHHLLAQYTCAPAANALAMTFSVSSVCRLCLPKKQLGVL